MSIDISALLGQTLKSFVVSDSETEVFFETTNGDRYAMYHEQECCEDVYLQDVNGELSDLVGSPLIQAEESSENPTEGNFESATWTFYKLATIKGYVTLRWFGQSNGYYSESVSIFKLRVGDRY